MSLYGNTDKTQNSEITKATAAVAAIATGKGIVLPTADPAVAGELWSNVGVVTVSAG